MRRSCRWLLTIPILLLLMVPPAHAFWKDKVAINEKNAAEYIEKLKSGADPDRVERPQMRFIKHYQAKQEQKRFLKAMDDAEALTRAGRPEEIKELELKYQDREKLLGRENSGY